MSKVTVIPATKHPITHMPKMSAKKRRVCGYARVSTDSDEQFTSYEAQVDYYTRLIQSNPEWEFVYVYTDEGITGTNTKHRRGFNEMISDALSGNIDLIITKSVSRFARNTVDSLVTVRKLKASGVECYFEKENIYTFDEKGELLLTIMSSIAQEESRSISENVTWGQRKRFADGKVSMPYKRFLGYRKGHDGKPEIVEDEAVTVRLIYKLFLDGKTAAGICSELEARGILSPAGKTKWTATTITSILKNEKYKGDALLQKKYTVDFLEKKMKTNTGEVPQYYVEGSHPAIVLPDEWDMVQAEIERRALFGNKYSGKSVFSAKLICEDCGSLFGSKVWHSNDKYRRVIWRCNSKFKGEHKCETPALCSDTIQAMFIKAYNNLIQNKEITLASCNVAISKISDFTAIDSEIEQLKTRTELLYEIGMQAVKENTLQPQDQEQYMRKYNAINQEYETLTQRLEVLEAKRTAGERTVKMIQKFAETVSNHDEPIIEWNDTLWLLTVEKATVHKNGSITFTFYNGTEITVEK